MGTSVYDRTRLKHRHLVQPLLDAVAPRPSEERLRAAADEVDAVPRDRQRRRARVRRRRRRGGRGGDVRSELLRGGVDDGERERQVEAIQANVGVELKGVS